MGQVGLGDETGGPWYCQPSVHPTEVVCTTFRLGPRVARRGAKTRPPANAFLVAHHMHQTSKSRIFACTPSRF